MSESLEGFSVAATRQNAGRLAAAGGAPRPPGGVNPPAATACTLVMVAFGMASAARLPQAPAACTRGENAVATPARVAATSAAPVIFMRKILQAGIKDSRGRILYFNTREPNVEIQDPTPDRSLVRAR